MKRRELISLFAVFGSSFAASAQERPEEKKARKAIWDEEVITLALMDVLTDLKSPLEVEFDGPNEGPRKMYFELEAPSFRPGLRHILREKESGGWEKLTQAQWDATTAAGRHLLRRASDKKPVGAFAPTDRRLVRITRDALKRQKRRIRQIFRPFPPGYSPDGSLAVVFLAFSWAGGYHAADATYLCERQNGKWQILARDSRIYP